MIKVIVLSSLLVTAVIILQGCSSFTQKSTGLKNNFECKKDLEYLRQQIEDQIRLDGLLTGMEMRKDARCDEVSDFGLVFDGKAFELDINGNTDFTGLYTPGNTYDGVEEGAAGSRYWSVRDNFGVWHTFRYSAAE